MGLCVFADSSEPLLVTYAINTKTPMRWFNYSKTCLKRPLKIDKTKILMTNGSLMKVESIVECSKGSPWSILQYF